MNRIEGTTTLGQLTAASTNKTRVADGIAVSISVVSHRQLGLIVSLLGDISAYCGGAIEILLTLNIEESLPVELEVLPFPVTIIRNAVPKGFGANHNAALSNAKGRHFCILNPDIRLSNNPFPGLIACLDKGHVGIAAPLVVNSEGKIEDSARRYPTPFRILSRILRKRRAPDYAIDRDNFLPDWVAGMFMLIPAEIFRSLGGFDERYFLYYEDVDLCARARLAGYGVMLCPKARVIHEARRQSHREWRYLRWHIRSMMRFFLSPVFRRIIWRKISDPNKNW